MSERFRELVIRAREDEEALIYIIECFESLVKKCIKVYLRDKSYGDDLIQVGRMTIMTCVKNYDIDSPYPFEAYVKCAVNYSARDFSYKIRRYISFDEKLKGEEEPLRDSLQSDMDVERDFIKKEEAGELRRAIRGLSERHRDIVMKYYFRRINLRKLSAEKKCHYSSVVQMKDRAIKRLRGLLEG